MFYDAECTLAQLTRTHVATAARASGEPDWLVERRVEAWDFFVQADLPAWRRTDLSRFSLEHIVPIATIQGTSVEWDESWNDQGVVFTTLKAALQSHEDIIRTNMGTAVNPLSHKFRALCAALWQDGIFLYVPANVAFEIPLHVLYSLPCESQAIFPYSLVIVEPGASVTFIEDFNSCDREKPMVAGATTELFLGEGSTLRFLSLQNWGDTVHHIGSQVQVLDTNAKSEWVSIALGATQQHIDAEARLQGDGSSVTWHGVTFSDKAQQLLTAPVLIHAGAHTESHVDFRTFVKDESYSVFDGMIRILDGSRATVTRLEEHAIHLSPAARSDSIPGLRIDTNDVTRAGHACTSGQIDEEQIFYMQSRGINTFEAMRMIVMGVFEPALNAIPREDIRTLLIETIEAKI